MSFFNKLKKEMGGVEIKIEKPSKGKAKKEETKIEAVKEEKEWFSPTEGQLAIDVYQTDGEIFIQSAIAGITPQDLDITIENDTVTIRGVRQKPADDIVSTTPKDYFYQECYWGPFSRQVILPAEVDGGRTEATMKDGILTIKVPKIDREKKRKIAVKE